MLTDEANRLRAAEGLVPVHGPGVVLVVNAVGLQAIDLQDLVNNLAVGGAEAIAINDRRVVVGVPVEQASGAVTIGGVTVPPPWTISAIGDANRLAQAADVMTQQMRTDRRVRQATYRVEADVVIRAVVSARPSFTRSALSQARKRTDASPHDGVAGARDGRCADPMH